MGWDGGYGVGEGGEGETCESLARVWVVVICDN